MHLPYYLAVLLLCCFASNSAGSTQQELVLTDAQGYYQLGEYLSILEDPSGKLSFEEVSSSKYSDQFQDSKQVVPNLGFTKSVIWARLKLRNSSAHNVQWMFGQNFANTHYLDLYFPTADSDSYQIKKSGNLLPTSSRDKKNRRIIFKVTVPIGSDQTLYLRMENAASMTLDFNLWSVDAFTDDVSLDAHIMGLFYGVIIIMFFYNLFLFYSLREASHGYLVLVIAILVITVSIYDGFMQYLFSDKLVHWSDDVFIIAFQSVSVAMLLFTRSFLPFEKSRPVQRRIQNGLILFYIFLYIPTMYFQYQMVQILILVNIFSSFFIIYRGYISLQDGNSSARIFLSAWVLFITSLIILQAMRFGLFESNVFTEQSVRFGWVWMVLFMSLALADRINRLRRQKETISTALTESEDRYRRLEESQIIGIIEADMNGNITRGNDIFLETIGYERKDLPLRWDEMTPDNWKARDELAVQQLQNTGIATPWEKEYIRKDGSMVPVMVGATIIGANSSNIIAFVLDLNEQKQTESERNISTGKYHLLFDKANDGIMIVINGVFVDCNQKILELFARTRDEIIGKTPAELSPPKQKNGRDSKEYSKEIIEDALYGHEHMFEWVHTRGDGSEIEMEISLSPVELEEQIFIFAFVRDITERKQIEEDLRKSAEKFNKAFHSSPDSLTITRASDGKIIEANEGFERVCGYSRNQVIGRTTLDLDLWVDSELRIEFIEKFRVSARVKDFMMQVNNPHRGVRDCLLTCEMMEVDGDACLLTIARDITVQKRAEVALRKSEVKFSKAFKASPDIIGISDIDTGEVIELNQSFERITGYSTGEAIGKRMSDLEIWANPDDRKQVIEDLKETNRVSNHEYLFRKKNGDTFFCLFSAEKILLEDRNVMLVNVTDITNQKLAEQNLIKANEEVNKLKEQLEAENIYLQEEIKTEHNFEEIIGNSAALKKVLNDIEQVASTDASVLINGESGTGKELIARAIHFISLRKDRPIVIVNCGAIPENLVESELFGHEKGAFTGAVKQHRGRFELAHGGTIFLDEVAELPTSTQVKLLRVLQEQEFERVGGSETIKVDVRVISATNQNFEKLLQAGKFRDDLYYRLNVFPVDVPPLRERTDDIPLLVMHFMREYNKKLGKHVEEISTETMRALMAYHWPGNIREFKNIIERAVIISRGSKLIIDERLLAQDNKVANNGMRSLDEIEREYILHVLDNTDNKIAGDGGAAKILGLNPNTLRSRMKKLGI